MPTSPADIQCASFSLQPKLEDGETVEALCILYQEAAGASDGGQTDNCFTLEGSIGIYFSSSHYLLCQYSDIHKLFFSTPKTPCSHINRIECMNVTCGHGEIVVGFKDDGVSVLGPCAKYSSTVSVLDHNDCHTVTGPPQGEQVEYDWKIWRICGGNEQDFYLMTAVHISENTNGILQYDSIICCRVKLV
ncbi:hypothetical protein E2C01_060666 [Portunus trituberculatus]|uniref:Uncharacterized protein n=1 Tax=Portunus trituberculatus TaxID=210409 RepID=A0A5B7HC37_PORTR|nr:hypothetical protein [Portunus trituberculatus]